MHFVVDANIIIAENFGRSVRFRTLLAASNTLGYKVYVPCLAITETVAKFSREFGEEFNSVRRILGQLSKLLGQRFETAVADLDPEKETASFKDSLVAKLNHAHVTQLHYPDTSHADVVHRAVSRKRPFDQNGSGYRDTLIWLSTLKLASQTDGTIVLVSKDGDFGKADALHSDLINDLVEAGHTKDKVALSPSLSNIIDEYIRPELKVGLLENPLETLANLNVDAQEAVLLAIQGAYNNVEWEPNELGLPSECETPILYYVERVKDLHVVEVRELPDGNSLVRVKTEVSGGFNFFMLKADLYVIDDDPRLDVADLDWNEYGLLGEVTLQLNATIDLLLDQANLLEPQAQVVYLAPPDA